MGLKVEPAYIGQTGYEHPVELDRNLLEGIFGRTGVLRFGDFAVTPTGTSGQISIAVGRAFLLGAENAQQGGYFVWSDGADTQLFAAASGNPRIDTLLLRVKDDQYGTISGSPSAYWDVVQGVAAGSPTARADSDFNSGGSFYVPGAWWRVADVRRNVGDTTIPGGQITHNLRYIRVPGGVTLCTTSTRPSDAVDGDEIYETDTGLRYRRVGGQWRLAAPYKQQNTLGSSAASVTFSSIPSSLKRIRVTYSARSDSAVVSHYIVARVNNDAAGDYRFQFVQISNGAAPSRGNGEGTGYASIGFIPGATASAGIYGTGHAEFMGWDGPHTNNLGWTMQSQFYQDNTNNAHMTGGGRYFPAGPYTSLVLLPQAGNFVAGSEFVLEGWD